MKGTYIALFIIGLASLSCTEQELFSYGEENFIYFEEVAGQEEVYPGTSYTFVFEEADVTTNIIEIPVLVTGKFPGRARAFTIRPVDSLSTAVEGVHYQILNEINTIEDQAVGGIASIQLKRAEDLKDEEVTITLQLVPDENFSPALNDIFEVKFSDFFSEPDWWQYEREGTDYHPTIGPFTQVKAGYWLEFYGIKDGSDPWCCLPHWDGSYFLTDEGVRILNNPVCNDDINTFILWMESLEAECNCMLRDENGERILDTLEYED